ncbi:hypothetical protein O181_110074 [Austropuccinia psidii MF-1]|uniref:Uncharacterized protein n=1 Tax=Austropuccinia psidii MF-1 TaxID=1389203 RepID=A0A9Q3JXM7_9BASI|nr:hypothetical protein [Austropuccinia psidii MF-1]
MIKVEHPQSQQGSKDQLNEQNQGIQRYQIASLSLLKAQNMLPSMVTLFLKLTGPAAELLPEGGIKPISNLMKVESNPESLTTTPPASRVTYAYMRHLDAQKIKDLEEKIESCDQDLTTLLTQINLQGPSTSQSNPSLRSKGKQPQTPCSSLSNN